MPWSRSRSRAKPRARCASRVMEALRSGRNGHRARGGTRAGDLRYRAPGSGARPEPGWNLLQNPAQMRIETIDALCAAITRRMPWLARFGAMPEISEKAEDLYREAARNTLRHRGARPRRRLAYLLLHLDNDFQRARRTSDQLRCSKSAINGCGTPERIRFHARATLERSLQRLILDELRRIARRVSMTMSPPRSRSFANWNDFPERAWMISTLWKTVADLLLDQKRRLAQTRQRASVFHRTSTQASLRAIARAACAAKMLLLECLERFRELPAPHFTDSQWQAMQAAVSVLTLAVAELQLVFRERGRVDFAGAGDPRVRRAGASRLARAISRWRSASASSTSWWTNFKTRRTRSLN